MLEMPDALVYCKWPCHRRRGRASAAPPQV